MNESALKPTDPRVSATQTVAQGNDLIERLREYRRADPYRASAGLVVDAADEIERLRSRLAEAEKSRDQYKAIVDRYCLRHDLKSCACEFGDDSDEPIQRCNYHLDLSNKLAEALKRIEELEKGRD